MDRGSPSCSVRHLLFHLDWWALGYLAPDDLTDSSSEAAPYGDLRADGPRRSREIRDLLGYDIIEMRDGNGSGERVVIKHYTYIHVMQVLGRVPDMYCASPIRHSKLRHHLKHAALRHMQRRIGRGRLGSNERLWGLDGNDRAFRVTQGHLTVRSYLSLSCRETCGQNQDISIPEHHVVTRLCWVCLAISLTR